MDAHSKSDAYVEVYAAETLIGSTRVARNTHEPVFNSHFVVNEMRESETIRFDIKDHDPGETDDLIDSISFNVQSILLQNMTGKPTKRKFRRGWIQVYLFSETSASLPMSTIFECNCISQFLVLWNPSDTRSQGSN